MGLSSISSIVVSVFALVLAFGLGYVSRERRTRDSRLAHKAAEKDSAHGMFNLALAYEKGTGTKPSIPDALEWFLAENGYTNRLGGALAHR